MRTGTQTWPSFESKTVSSNIKLLWSAVLQSVLTFWRKFFPSFKGSADLDQESPSVIC